MLRGGLCKLGTKQDIPFDAGESEDDVIGAIPTLRWSKLGCGGGYAGACRKELTAEWPRMKYSWPLLDEILQNRMNNS